MNRVLAAHRLAAVCLQAAAGALMGALASDLAEPHSSAKHWAYQPPVKAAVPNVKDTAWPRNDIDRFILARLEAKGLKPVAPADKTILVRRIYYDLIGLPPTPEQIDEFVHDFSAEAVARLVDRLLGSPNFGERWGRHWLDVVRYAESLTLRGFVFPEAWRYRDYVIEAFNGDYPYDRFVKEQIAGDLLPAASIAVQRRQRIATAFLVLGNINLEEQDKKQLDMDVVDEQLDTMGKAFLAQTVGCARCHDHKFDPIPTRDYYAMAGILRSSQTLEHANVSKWLELPLPVEREQEEIFKKHEAAVVDLQAQLKEAKGLAAKLGVAGAQTTNAKPGRTVAVSELPGVVVDDAQASRVGNWVHSQYSKSYVGDGYLHDGNTEKGEKTLTFHPQSLRAGRYELRLAYVPANNRAARVPVNILHADGESAVYVNEQVPPLIDGRFVSLGQYRFEANGQGYVLISNEGTRGHVIADAVQYLPLDKPEVGIAKSREPGRTELDEKTAQAKKAADGEVKRLEAVLKDLTDRGPKRPLYMSVKEGTEISDLRVHHRGSVHNLGDPAPRGFLQVATRGRSPAIPEKQSGRLELAEWLARSSNPLTARVMVNRVWNWLFGAGLVRTTDNFGTTGEAPSHIELLDTLAVRFMEQGWSVKKLVREIVLSQTYQLSSAAAELGEDAFHRVPDSRLSLAGKSQGRSGIRPDQVHGEGKPSPAPHAASVSSHARSPAAAKAQEMDPENRWLWRMNRRRLDAECLRDSVLFVSGQLQLEIGGSTIQPGTSADYGYKHTDARRSVYVPVFRNALPDLFEVFDFADPSMVTGRRHASTVAPQALFFMNHPFVTEQAQRTAKRLRALSGLDEWARVDRAYRIILGRPPSQGERAVAMNHLTAQVAGEHSEPNEAEAWAQLCQALFASMDFRYLE